MGFVRLATKLKKGVSDVKVAFRLKPTFAVVYLSHDILERLEWGRECRVFVSIDEDYPMKWMLEKTVSLRDSHKGSSYGQRVNYSILQFKLKNYSIDTLKTKSHPVDFSLYCSDVN
jgi:hypothetical protein